MARATTSVLAVLAILAAVAHGLELDDIPEGCASKCGIEISWDDPLYACSVHEQTFGPSTMCVPFGASLFRCYIAHMAPPHTREGWLHPGTCECPNNCSPGRGECVGDRCVCSPGWGGADCSAVDCSVASPCANGGQCRIWEDKYECMCKDGWAGDDCTVPARSLAPIVETFSAPQYGGSDKYGDEHPVFNTSTVAQLFITMDPDDLKFVLDPYNRLSKEYMKADMVFTNGVFNDTIKDIGFRIKGGISRTFAKKTWKISFNKFESGRKWYGLKKLDIRAGAMDASFARDPLSMALLRSMGAPVQRASFMRMKINGIDFGVQFMAENIDDRYLKSRFEYDEGALYKCQGDLSFVGFDPELYREVQLLGRPSYQPKTDAAEDFTALSLLIATINLSEDDAFERDISSQMDMDLFLRTLAMEALGGQVDGLCNGNNYMLYRDPLDNKFKYLRHDFDASMGFGQIPFTTMNIYEWCDLGRGYHFIKRVLAVPSFRDTYSKYIKQLALTYFTEDGPWVERLFQIRDQLAPMMKTDIWHRMDFSWSYEQFYNSFTDDIVLPTAFKDFPDMTVQGLTHYIHLRRESALEQLAMAGY